MPLDMQLPRYQCHKKVWALKIRAIEFKENGDAVVAVEAPFLPLELKNYRSNFKGNENDLGYYIQYEDGYKSWSPTKAFEDGYTKL